MSDTLVKHELDHEDVHTVSVGLLQVMMDNGVGPDLAIAGLAMTLARMLSPQALDPDQEVKFVEDLSEWGSMYFMDTDEAVN